MKRLAPWLVVALAAGCAATQKEPPPRPFAGTVWQVDLVQPLPGRPPSVRFADGRMEGYGGCNRIAAKYVQDTVGANAIAIGRIDSGMRAACDPAAQIAEIRLLETLQAVSSYSIKGDVMTMSGSAGTVRLRAAPETGPR